MLAATQTRAAARAAGASDYEDPRARDEFLAALNQTRGRAAREQSGGLTIPEYRRPAAVARSPAAPGSS